MGGGTQAFVIVGGAFVLFFLIATFHIVRKEI